MTVVFYYKTKKEFQYYIFNLYLVHCLEPHPNSNTFISIPRHSENIACLKTDFMHAGYIVKEVI